PAETARPACGLARRLAPPRGEHPPFRGRHEPRKRRSVLAPGGAGGADARRREREPGPQQVAGRRARPTGDDRVETPPLRRAEELVAAEAGEQRAARGGRDERDREVGVERPEQSVVAERFGRERADDV